MLNLLGIGYFTDALIAALNTQRRTEAFAVYVTDCLHSIGQSLGVKYDRRFYDILHPRPVDHRPADQIAADRLNRFGIKVVTPHESI